MTQPRHSELCLDEDGVLDFCVCGLQTATERLNPDRYDPDDREPMGGDPYWQEEQ